MADFWKLNSRFLDLQKANEPDWLAAVRPTFRLSQAQQFLVLSISSQPEVSTVNGFSPQPID